jgi:hypothetical protein
MSSHAAAVGGLGLLAGGSLINGLLLHAPVSVLIAGRVLAGLGAGLVLFAGPRLLPPGRRRSFDWFAVILPAVGLLVVARVTLSYGWSSWEGGFLFEGVLAVFGLALVVPLVPPPEPPLHHVAPLGYWLPLALAIAGLWYLLHWGHLSGWFEDTLVFATAAATLLGLTLALWLVWPSQDAATVLEAWPRLALAGFAGLVQFFNAFDAGVAGGLFVNLSDWQRAVLIWPIPLGAATALAAGLFIPPGRIPHRTAALIGLVILAVGFAWAYQIWMDWPFWSVLNPVEFQWFAAPQTWELAGPRFLMGLGHGITLLAAAHRISPDPQREARIRPALTIAQFAGGGLGIGILATALVAWQQWQYAYASDRGTIQAEEVAERTARLAEVFAAAGSSESARPSAALMQRSVVYQSNALVFADLYATFAVVSAALAGMVVIWMAWDRITRSGQHADNPAR